MPQRNKKTVYLANWAAEKRGQLIKDLGGKCAICGTRKNLQIDHIYGRDWEIRSKSRWQRQIIYRREFEQGLLRCLCAAHNANAGKSGSGESVAATFNKAIADIIPF